MRPYVALPVSSPSASLSRSNPSAPPADPQPYLIYPVIPPTLPLALLFPFLHIVGHFLSYNVILLCLLFIISSPLEYEFQEGRSLVCFVLR